MMRSAVGLGAAAALLLTGCGVQGTQFHPGVAATVGDQTISQSRINDLAGNYCTAYRSRLHQAGQLYPLGFLKTGIVEQLIARDAALQLADDYDVAKGDTTYRQAVAQTREATKSLPSNVSDAVVELETSQSLIDAILTEIGGVELLKQRETGATTDQEKAAGQKVLAHWLDTHTVDVNPQYGFTYHDGQPTTGDTGVSYALSTAAKAGQAQQPSQDYAATLPSNQVCG